MFEREINKAVDLTINGDDNQDLETKRKNIYAMMNKIKSLKTDVTFNMHLMILSSITDENDVWKF